MDGGADRAKWEERYGAADYQPERQPVPFLVEAVAGLTPGAALCLAAGAGRNAVHLAALGWRVTAVDVSPRGLAWCRRLAAERGVTVETVEADLTCWDPGGQAWDLVTMVFYYDPALFPAVRRAVRPAGHFLLYTFTLAQLAQGWGPRSATHLARAEDLRRAFGDWTFVRFEEGLFPRGDEGCGDERCGDERCEAVVRLLARMPG